LTVDKSSPQIIIKAPTGTSGDVQWANSAGTPHWTAYELIGGSNSIGNWKVYDHTVALDRLTIAHTTGYVGIGTTSPNGKFEVASSAAGETVGLFLADATNNTVYVGRLSTTPGSGSSFVVRGRQGTVAFTVNAVDNNAKTATTLGVGDATPASGAGITFPATQSASTDANTLDDYEEGTWTPAQGGGLTVVGTFSSSGSYTKIGRQVTAIGTVAATTSVSYASGALITSIPIACQGPIPTGVILNSAATVSSVVSGNPTTSAIYSAEAIAATSALYFSITYFV
jgi:hypothetical protein